jgi:Leucine-rich repeat (LRR) protein
MGAGESRPPSPPLRAIREPTRTDAERAIAQRLRRGNGDGEGDLGDSGLLDAASWGGSNRAAEVVGAFVLLRRRRLLLNGCRVAAVPTEIDRLAALLGELNLSNNLELRGPLPPTIGSLSLLTELNISGTQISELPTEIGQLGLLERLYCNGCPLLEIPAEVGQLANLRFLHAMGCRLTTLPPEIGALTKLQHLSVKDNHEFREMPPEVGDCSALETLSVAGCLELSELPATVGYLSKLRRLGTAEANEQRLEGQALEARLAEFRRQLGSSIKSAGKKS